MLAANSALIDTQHFSALDFPAPSTSNIMVPSTRRSQYFFHRRPLPLLPFVAHIPQRSSSLAAVLRQKTDDVKRIVQIEAGYSEHILACSIPLPEADGDEQRHLSEEYSVALREPQGNTV